MAKIQEKHINQIKTVWYALLLEANSALSRIDFDNDCDGKYFGILEQLDDRFKRALENIINDANE